MSLSRIEESDMLGKAWAASTRMSRMNRKDILGAPLGVIAQEIRSLSNIPLRLFAHLLHGIVRMYQQEVRVLVDDVDVFTVKIKKSLASSSKAGASAGGKKSPVKKRNRATSDEQRGVLRDIGNQPAEVLSIGRAPSNDLSLDISGMPFVSPQEPMFPDMGSPAADLPGFDELMGLNEGRDGLNVEDLGNAVDIDSTIAPHHDDDIEAGRRAEQSVPWIGGADEDFHDGFGDIDMDDLGNGTSMNMGDISHLPQLSPLLSPHGRQTGKRMLVAEAQEPLAKKPRAPRASHGRYIVDRVTTLPDTEHAGIEDLAVAPPKLPSSPFPLERLTKARVFSVLDSRPFRYRRASSSLAPEQGRRREHEHDSADMFDFGADFAPEYPDDYEEPHKSPALQDISMNPLSPLGDPSAEMPEQVLSGLGSPLHNTALPTHPHSTPSRAKKDTDEAQLLVDRRRADLLSQIRDGDSFSSHCSGTRRAHCRTFVDVLALATQGRVDLEQHEPYGEITLHV